MTRARTGRRAFLIGAAAALPFAPAAAQTAPPRLVETGSIGAGRDGLQDAPPDWALRPERRPFSSAAPNAIVVDLASGAVLLDQASGRAIPPASMTKMMTAFLAFDAFADGRLAPETRIAVSRRAAAMGGSTMGLGPGERPTAQQLVEGIVIASGNDAAVALAEALAGSEAGFADAMTARAQALGLASARFRNATGFSEPGHVVSVADLARLSALLHRRHPGRMDVFARGVMRWNGIRRWNRNTALSLDLRRLDAACDGLKTGYTRAAGYCVALSARQSRPDRRIVAVLAGLPSERARERESARLLRWALAQR